MEARKGMSARPIISTQGCRNSPLRGMMGKLFHKSLLRKKPRSGLQSTHMRGSGTDCVKKYPVVKSFEQSFSVMLMLFSCEQGDLSKSLCQSLRLPSLIRPGPR